MKTRELVSVHSRNHASIILPIVWVIAGCSEVLGDDFKGLSPKACMHDGGPHCMHTDMQSADGAAGITGTPSTTPSRRSDASSMLGAGGTSNSTRGPGSDARPSVDAGHHRGAPDASVATGSGGSDASIAPTDGGTDASIDSGGPSFEPTGPLDDPSITGSTWGSPNAPTVANIPVCFATAPHREWDGTVSCRHQSAGTDCAGNAFANGQETALRNQLRALLGETWERNARLTFTGFHACPVDTTTSVVEIGSLPATVVVSFGPLAPTKATTGIGKRRIASDVHVNISALASGDHAGTREILREFGHVLGFPYEWVRFSPNAPGTCPSIMPADPNVVLPFIPEIPDPTSVMDRCANLPDTPPLLSTGDVMGVHEVYGRKHNGALVGTNGQCLTAAGRGASIGARVLGSSCDGALGNGWTRWPTNGAPHFVMYGQPNDCLGIDQGADAATGLLPVVNDLCAVTDGQRIPATGLEWRAIGNMCVAANGDSLVLADCNGGDSQRWNFWEGDPTSPLSWSQIQSSDGRCVASKVTPAPDWANSLVDKELLLAACDSSDVRQLFQYRGDGFIGLGGNSPLCVNVLGGAPVPGARLALWDACLDPTADNSSFYVTASFRVSDRCLAMDGSGAVFAEPCAAGSARQIWDFHF